MNVAQHESDAASRTTGETILSILKSRDLSMVELGKYLSLHRSYVSRMLHGANPVEPYLPKISEYLSVPIEKLRTGDASGTSYAAAHRASIARYFSPLPFGPLEADGHVDVPNGCIIKRVDKSTDAPADIGAFVLLGPAKGKPKGGDLVYCSTLKGDVFIRTYALNAADRDLFLLLPNSSDSSTVAINHASVYELRVVAIRNLNVKE